MLDQQVMSLHDVMNMEVGTTIMFNATPDSRVTLRCGGVTLMDGKMGRTGNSIAIRIVRALRESGEQA